MSRMKYIEGLLYKKPGVSADQFLYRDFNKEAVYKAMARKGETLKHLWQKYNAIGVVDGKKPMSYRQYCRRYSEWADSKQLTFHIQRYPGVNLELDYAGKQLYLHNRRNPEEATKVTIFIAALTYSDYFYAEGMTECDIRNWIRVNNNALAYFGGVTPTVTPDNCKVAVSRNKDWISPVLNKDFQAWAEHNNTVLTPAKVKSPRWKPVVEGHVKIITMHILMDMEDMVFYSLDDLNRVLMEKVAAENRKPFEGLSYSRYDLFTTEEKESLLPLPPNRFEYLERKTVKVAQDFSFTFDKVHYSMPRKYLRQELEIRAGEKEIYTISFLFLWLVSPPIRSSVFKPEYLRRGIRGNMHFLVCVFYNLSFESLAFFCNSYFLYLNRLLYRHCTALARFIQLVFNYNISKFLILF